MNFLEHPRAIGGVDGLRAFVSAVRVLGRVSIAGDFACLSSIRSHALYQASSRSKNQHRLGMGLRVRDNEAAPCA